MAATNPDRSVSAMPISEWETWVADNPDIPVELRDGTTLLVPPFERWNFEAWNMVSENPVAALALVLTTEQHQQIVTAGDWPMRILEVLGKRAGVDLGKSSASSGS